jgi:hypothetical protein
MWERLFNEIDQANPLCCRCGQRWRAHLGGASDHLFFDHPDDVPDEENN